MGLSQCFLLPSFYSSGPNCNKELTTILQQCVELLLQNPVGILGYLGPGRELEHQSF